MANERRLIDANLLRGKQQVSEVNGKLTSVICFADIVNAPTVAAIEVVRCKDCNYFSELNREGEHYCEHWDCDDYKEALISEDDFCSYGERKSGTQPQREDV